MFINFGQQPFTYPVTGHDGLYQTWEQQKGTAIRLAEARIADDHQRISELEQVITNQSEPFVRGQSHSKETR